MRHAIGTSDYGDQVSFRVNRTGEFWIGIEPPKLENQPKKLLHIPNFYEFKHNLEANDSNTVGFASRMETRKCPHYLQRIPSCLLYTSPSPRDATLSRMPSWA